MRSPDRRSPWTRRRGRIPVHLRAPGLLAILNGKHVAPVATRFASGPVNELDSSEAEIAEALENFEQTGCNNTAYQDVYASEGSVFGIYEELSDSFRDLQERVESDPRVVEFNSQWQTCIGESGVQAEVEADEIAFSLVSLDCGVPPPLVGQPQIFLEVRYELELAMIEENQEIFDRFNDLDR